MAPHSADRKQVKRLLAKMKKLAQGFQAHGSLLKKFVVNGVRMTPAQALARLRRSLATDEKAQSLKTQTAQALAVRDKAVLGDEDFVVNLPVALTSAYGPTPKLEDFGIPWKKTRKKRTAAEEAISAALRLQTRQVRGTMGKKQRAALTVAGKPGVLVVDPSGKPIGGRPPIPPAKPPKK